MRIPKQTFCKQSHCHEPADNTGFCKRHFDEDNLNSKRRTEAIEVLHFGKINGHKIQSPELLSEYSQIERWWSRACIANNFGTTDSILKDEVEYALEWCISLAQIIVQEELEFRISGKYMNTNNYIRSEVWSRFKNLQAGLMSNGISRKPLRST
jgi:hypothetical protein